METSTPSGPGRIAITVYMLLIAVAALWVIEIVDTVANDALQGHGIRPRTLAGLEGLLFAPFLHTTFGHVAANTIPFAVLGGLVMARSVRTWVLVTGAIMVGGGGLIWLFARSGNHLGASILVFGYLGFLIAYGFFDRSLTSIGIAVIVGVVYGGLLVGVLPSAAGVSWEGHLFGFVAGGVAARLSLERKGVS